MPTKRAHGERQLIIRPDGTAELHIIAEGLAMWSIVDGALASLIADGGCPVAVLQNGLLALSYPGCTTAPIRCDCRKLDGSYEFREETPRCP